MTEEEVVEALEAGRAYAARSLTATTTPATARRSSRSTCSRSRSRGYEAAENRELLAAGLRTLDERERRIVQLRFVDGLTQSQIAAEIGVSQMHVSRLLRRALEKLGEEIEAP